MIEPLNPLLFARLEQYYGANQVEIIAPGERIEWRLDWEPVPDSDKLVASRAVLASGEEYRVRCFRCRDHRARLYINHRWGVWDPATRSRNLWLVNCWNENCYSEYEHQKWLYDRVYALGPTSRKSINILPGRVGAPIKLRDMPLPGTVYRLDELAKKMPGHSALSYLVDRGFDPIKLGQLWGVGYCSSSRMHFATDRIFIPIHMQKMLVGWQARYIGDNVNGMAFNKARVPKYWSCPNMPRRLLAYNIERALRHKTLLLVEGPADCWNMGPMAAGLIGKTLSEQVCQLIIDGMKKHGNDGAVVVMLDPKKDPRDTQRNKPHHIDRVVSQLWKPLRRRVFPVYLDEAYDPGSIDRDWCRDLIRAAAAKHKLPVFFTKPS